MGFNCRDSPVIEITPAMIEAGIEVYINFDPDADDLDGFLCGVFRSMYLARASQTNEEK